METSSANAAEVVMRERERQRDIDRRKAAAEGAEAGEAPPEMEAVSVPRWEGAEAGEVDESELDRRQRAIAERLDRRQREVKRTGQELARVRAELKALEEPIKAEIMKLRERLEDSNRKEKALVDTVNTLRKDLHTKEIDLKRVRDDKQDSADQLIRVMADYERRKTERLNEISAILGDESATNSAPGKKKASTEFAGF